MDCLSWQNGILTPWNISISEELKRNIINQAIVTRRDSESCFRDYSERDTVVSKNRVLRYQFNKGIRLQNNTVLALEEDIHQQLWIGLDQGIDGGQNAVTHHPPIKPVIILLVPRMRLPSGAIG